MSCVALNDLGIERHIVPMWLSINLAQHAELS